MTSSPLAILLVAALTSASPARAQFYPGPFPPQTEFLVTEAQARVLEARDECPMFLTYREAASPSADAALLSDAILTKKRLDECPPNIGTIFVQDRQSGKAATAQARTKAAIKSIYSSSPNSDADNRASGLVHFPGKYVYIGH